jgi:hypothetical protein
MMEDNKQTFVGITVFPIEDSLAMLVIVRVLPNEFVARGENERAFAVLLVILNK